MDECTPGPWKVLPSETGVSYIRIRGTTLGSRYKIANILFYNEGLPPTLMAREVQEAEANARLVAAAPEMFSVITEAIDALDPDMRKQDIVIFREWMIRVKSKIEGR